MYLELSKLNNFFGEIYMKPLYSKFLVSLLMIFLANSNVWGESKVKSSKMVYTVGVVPQFSTMRIVKTWSPILKEIENRTGYKFTLKGSPSIPEFEKEFQAGKFDFAYMNPYHLLIANQAQGYIPILNDKKRSLQGILVVGKDSSVSSVKDLDGKLVAFPAPNALGASLLIRAALKDEFNIQIKPQFVKTHSSVYLNVALDEMQAGGGVQKTLSRQPEDIKKEIRVLYRTKSVAPHPLVAHPRVPEKVREIVLEAFTFLNSTLKGDALLKEVPLIKIGPALLKDYLPLSTLNLERFIAN
jgi:phosphonate transport system substrate-binding protein